MSCETIRQLESYTLGDYDLTSLFDSSASPISFAEAVKDHVPNVGSIIYTVWDKEGNFVYVGIAGMQKLLKKRSPLRRMQSHASGRRSGDQFNIYVHDYYVVPDLIRSGKYEYKKGILDRLTREYIQENLSYRFMSFLTEDSNKIVVNLENQIKAGALGIKPLLNHS